VGINQGVRNMSDDNGSNYEVGYRRPPKANQFKKGQSGNPKGRKRGEQIEDVRIVVEEILAEPVKLREGGRVRTVSKLEAMLNAQLVDALKGNPKAVRALFKLGQKTSLFTRAKPKSCMVIDPPGTDEQKIILRAFHADQDALNGAEDGDDRAASASRSKPPDKGR
jgi:hypothetical protein